MEYQLASLGLNQNQIDNVLRRLSPNQVQLFIEQWKKEKSLSNNTQNINQNNTNQYNYQPSSIYETRRKNYQNDLKYSRDQEFAKESVKIPYMPRMLPKPTERATTEEIESKYQQKNQSRNNPSANLDIMCRQLFGEPTQGYNAQYLHKKYKQLAITFHPDKHGGDNNPFHMLTMCYNHLKNSLPDVVEERKTTRENIAVPPPDSLFDQKFDPSVFNEYYTKNAFVDEKVGHGNWLKSQPDIKQPTRPSESNFHSEYEKQKRIYTNNMDSKTLQLIKRPDIPEELATNNYSNVQLLGTGEEDVEDFSGQTENGTKYTDIRRALETPHLTYEKGTINETNVSQSFANAKQNRSNTPGKLTQEEERMYQELKYKQKEQEDYRRYKLRQRDEDIETHFQNIHHNRIGMG
tara:strand:+ start:5895 stop:7112 length:1218 start_codon:yes stop_codon:yes gene_type:complete